MHVQDFGGNSMTTSIMDPVFNFIQLLGEGLQVRGQGGGRQKGGLLPIGWGSTSERGYCLLDGGVPQKGGLLPTGWGWGWQLRDDFCLT